MKKSLACLAITRGSTIVQDARRRSVVKVGLVLITKVTLVFTAIGVKNAIKAIRAREITMITWRNTKVEPSLATSAKNDSKRTAV